MLKSRLQLCAHLRQKSAHQILRIEIQQVSSSLKSLTSCHFCISGPSTPSSSVWYGNTCHCQELTPTLEMKTSQLILYMVIQIQQLSILKHVPQTRYRHRHRVYIKAPLAHFVLCDHILPTFNMQNSSHSVIAPMMPPHLSSSHFLVLEIQKSGNQPALAMLQHFFFLIKLDLQNSENCLYGLDSFYSAL